MPLRAGELEPLLRLSMVEGIGPQRLNVLLDRFRCAGAVLRASEGELRAVPGIGAEIARRLRSASSAAAVRSSRRALHHLAELGAVVLDAEDPAYPPAFSILPDRPPLLFALGELERLRLPAVAIVGTRTPTAYGRRVAIQLGSDLGRAGYAVVSGMARGVDTSAHTGALAAGGVTIGILGHGIDLVYPPENRRLFDQVRERGVLLTEYAPGETPKAGNFPRRNRLITALSRAVVVVEMGHQSGAQHTVSFALEQGRDVMAVPGPIESAASAGTNQLIKEGARLVASVEDIIDELEGVGVGSGGASSTGTSRTCGAPSPELADGTLSLPLLSPAETRLLEVLSAAPRHVDELSGGTGMPPAAVLASLLELELRGLVAALPGKRFTRC